MASRKLQVEIIGDASSLNRAFRQVGGSSNKLGSSLKTLGKIAAIGVGAAFAGLAATLKIGFDELSEGQKVAAQTGAVLKSTGQAANVTAKQVENLASSISKMTGVDDEAIQAGENLLLTFTSIRNEVGQGNDIFNQATVAITDMSVALGQDMSASAIQLGKALNDPIRGVTALRRVGVSFTESQEDMIKSLVESGDTLGAQKLILAELTKEFGGSAKAAGETLPGQLSKLRNAFDEVAASLAETLLPFITRFINFLNRNMGTIQAFIQSGLNVLVVAFKGIGDALSLAQGPLGAFRTYLEENPGKAKILAGALAGLAAALTTAAVAQAALNLAVLANPYVAAVAAVGLLVGALAALYLTNERVRQSFDKTYGDLRTNTLTTIAVLTAVWKRFGEALTAIAKAAALTVTLGFRNLFDAMRGIFNVFAGLFTGDWRRMWTGVTQLFDAAIGNLLKVIRAQIDALLSVGKAMGAAIVEGITTGLSKLAGAVRNLAVGAGRAFVEGMREGLSTLGSMLASAIKAPINAVIRAWNAIGLPGFSVSIPGPGPVPDINFSFGGISLPDIPQLKTGGITKRDMFAQLHANEAVIPLSQAPGLMGGGVIENHVNVYLDGKRVWESVQREEARYQIRNGRTGFA